MMGEEINTVREEDSVDVNQIRELIKIVEMSDVNEVVVEEGGAKVVVRRGVSSAFVEAAANPPVAAPAEATDQSAPAAPPTDVAVRDDAERPASWKSVVAPMVGTFYRSPSPGADAFVNVGDTVEEGQGLCILEAMKLMNEITAEEPGVIREIAVGDAEAVEYGTVLFYYEPLG